MENEAPKRKPNRLKEFDYSTPRGYFITICAENRRKIFSSIVGEGLREPQTSNLGLRTPGLAPPEIQLTKLGKIVNDNILSLPNRYNNLQIGEYVIMPNHIHIIFILIENTGGASPSPTISDIVCSLKSKSTIESRKFGFKEKVFQRSFYDHVIRNRQDYDEIRKYIYENPLNWKKDELY